MAYFLWWQHCLLYYFACLTDFMPESPHFLISKGREDDARKALEKVRFDDQIDWEIEGKLTT